MGDQPHAIAAGASDRYPLVAAPADSPHPPGADAFTLTVTGTNFTRASRVLWKGLARPTTFVSSTQLTAQIPGSDVIVPAKIPRAIPPALRNPTNRNGAGWIARPPQER